MPAANARNPIPKAIGIAMESPVCTFGGVPGPGVHVVHGGIGVQVVHGGIGVHVPQGPPGVGVAPPLIFRNAACIVSLSRIVPSVSFSMVVYPS